MKDLDSKLIYEAYNNSKQEDILLDEGFAAALGLAGRGLGVAKNAIFGLFKSPQSKNLLQKMNNFTKGNPIAVAKQMVNVAIIPSIALLGGKVFKLITALDNNVKFLGGAAALIYLYMFLAKRGDKMFDKLSDDEKKSDKISPERLKELVQEVTEEDPEDSNLTIGSLEEVKV